MARQSWRDELLCEESGHLGRGQREGGVCVVAGRYQLLDLIGEGGMGIVWRGFDLELEEVVALKFLREDLAGDERRRACFRREVKLARQVTHPNVARVFEFGRDGDLYFLTMEFVGGQSLQTALRRPGPMTPLQVYRHAVGLCRGLAAAHVAGIVHGDIKPGNILLSPRRGAVLTDFGIARGLSDVLSLDENVGGTPLYMAPEQILGGTLALQSDIYAAGVVLFEALTGELPWGTGEVTELLVTKCGPELDLRAVAPGLPDAWARLITSCLRTDPAERPADGRALLARLREVGGTTKHDQVQVNISELAADYVEQPAGPSHDPRSRLQATRQVGRVVDPPVRGPGRRAAAAASSSHSQAAAVAPDVAGCHRTAGCHEPGPTDHGARVNDTTPAGGAVAPLKRSHTARNRVWPVPESVTLVRAAGAPGAARTPALPACAPLQVGSQHEPVRPPEPRRRLNLGLTRDPTNVLLWPVGAGVLGVLRRKQASRGLLDGCFAVAAVAAAHDHIQVYT